MSDIIPKQSALLEENLSFKVKNNNLENSIKQKTEIISDLEKIIETQFNDIVNANEIINILQNDLE